MKARLDSVLLISICVELLLSLVIFPRHVLGQQPTYHFFGKDDGLPSENLYDVLIDDDNFIWFSSDKGISRFDGSAFQNYTIIDGLPDNEVFSLFLDSRNRMWFGSLNGVPGFYENGVFYNPSNCRTLQGMHNENYISAICESPKGTIYIGARDGRVHEVGFNGPAKFLFQEIPSSMAAIAFRKDGTLEVSSSSCEILTFKGGVKKYEMLLPEQHPLVHEVMVATKLQSGHFVMGYGAKLSVIDLDYSRKNFINETLRADNVSIIKIKQSIPFGIFVCTTKGAYLFPNLDFSNQNPRIFLPGKHVSSVAEDSEGGLWFTTKEGVYYSPVPDIRLGPQSPFTQSSNVSAIGVLSSEKLVLGYDDGAITLLDNSRGETHSMSGPIKGNYSLKANSFVPRPDGRFWVTTDAYLGLCDIQTNRVLPTLYVTGQDLAVNGDSLCFCHSFGWKVYSQSLLLKQALEQKPTLVGNLHSFERCFAVHYDPHGALWVATNGSLSKIQNNDTTRFPDLENRLNGSRITDITSDINGNVWLSTAGAGLVWIRGASILHLDDLGFGMPKNVSQISVVSPQLLGAASDQGFFLIGYDPQHDPIITTKRIGALDGLPSDEVSDFCLLDSTLWIATPKGYSSFPLKMLFDQKLHPAARIAKFIFGKGDSIGGQNPRIAFEDQGVSIFFSGIGHRSLGNFNYKYNLSGLDDDWHSSSIGQVEYPYLEPGDYNFQVFSQNHQGNWSILPATYRFTILTPFWKTIWFRIVLLSLILILLFIIFRAFLLSERRRARFHQKLNDAEQRALIGQMNPHFIFNSLNSIQQYYMTHDLMHANVFLSEFGELIRSTLNNSRKPFVSLTNEVSEVRTYLGLEALRLNHAFQFQIEVQPELQTKDYQIPTMLLQPFLENAIWHGVSHLRGRIGYIHVRFSIKNGMLCCEIEDNGIGRDQSKVLRTEFGKKRKSHATNIAQERINLMNRSGSQEIIFEIIDLYDASRLPAGTRVLLCFPLFANLNPEYENY